VSRHHLDGGSSSYQTEYGTWIGEWHNASPEADRAFVLLVYRCMSFLGRSNESRSVSLGCLRTFSERDSGIIGVPWRTLDLLTAQRA
jgi:hypothetical protein